MLVYFVCGNVPKLHNYKLARLQVCTNPFNYVCITLIHVFSTSVKLCLDRLMVINPYYQELQGYQSKYDLVFLSFSYMGNVQA